MPDLPARTEPGPGQESVWDYPRPPRVEQRGEHVRIVLGGITVAETDRAWCVLETSHPPAYYLPPDAFLAGTLRPAPGSSYCEWKGTAHYLDVVSGDQVADRAAWSYSDPSPGFVVITDHVALYPAAMDACFVDDEPVVSQPGGFYGGWITSKVSGPFKGAPGTNTW